MRKWKLVLVIIVLAIGLPLAAFVGYEWWSCRPKEKAYRARLAEIRRQLETLPLGASKEQVEQFLDRSHWSAHSIPEDGRPALVVQEIVERCGSLVCDDEVVIRVTIRLDSGNRVANKDVRVWSTCL